MIHLSEVTEDNWLDVADLSVKDSQRAFLAPGGMIPGVHGEKTRAVRMQYHGPGERSASGFARLAGFPQFGTECV